VHPPAGERRFAADAPRHAEHAQQVPVRRLHRVRLQRVAVRLHQFCAAQGMDLSTICRQCSADTGSTLEAVTFREFRGDHKDGFYPTDGTSQETGVSGIGTCDSEHAPCMLRLTCGDVSWGLEAVLALI
jgi:hypothetical protein